MHTAIGITGYKIDDYWDEHVYINLMENATSTREINGLTALKYTVDDKELEIFIYTRFNTIDYDYTVYIIQSMSIFNPSHVSDNDLSTPCDGSLDDALFKDVVKKFTGRDVYEYHYGTYVVLDDLTPEQAEYFCNFFWDFKGVNSDREPL